MIRRSSARRSTVAARLGSRPVPGTSSPASTGSRCARSPAAVNAGILPAALAAAEVVDARSRREAPDAPLLVMRGDGGSAGMHDDAHAIRS